MKKVRVLMIDDNYKLIEAVKETFKNSSKIDISLEADNGKKGFELIKNR